MTHWLGPIREVPRYTFTASHTPQAAPQAHHNHNHGTRTPTVGTRFEKVKTDLCLSSWDMR